MTSHAARLVHKIGASMPRAELPQVVRSEGANRELVRQLRHRGLPLGRLDEAIADATENRGPLLVLVAPGAPDRRWGRFRLRPLHPRLLVAARRDTCGALGHRGAGPLCCVRSPTRWRSRLAVPAGWRLSVRRAADGGVYLVADRGGPMGPSGIDQSVEMSAVP